LFVFLIICVITVHVFNTIRTAQFDEQFSKRQNKAWHSRPFHSIFSSLVRQTDQTSAASSAAAPPSLHPELNAEAHISTCAFSACILNCWRNIGDQQNQVAKTVSFSSPSLKIKKARARPSLSL
jgi:hypothetical protein